MRTFEIEPSALGRIVVPKVLPRGKALFYTTIDFPGRLDDAIANEISGVIAKRFRVEARLATCTQVHGVTVQHVEKTPDWRECDSCDALWTNDRRVALGIKVADCLPVSIVADGVIANIHSGWRGAVAQITAKTIDALPVDTQRAYAYLGPTIRVCCFEVGEEVATQFPQQFVDRRYPKPHVDIPAFTAAVLCERGIAGDHIFDSGLCTRCEGSMFHSYRRDRSTGRNLAIVAQ